MIKLRYYTMIFCLLSIILIILWFCPVRTKLTGITIEEFDSELCSSYGITNKDIKDKNVKKAGVEVELNNFSIQKFYGVNLEFADNDNSVCKDFVLTDRIDTELPWYVNCKPFSKTKATYYVIVDATDMSNGEIKEKIKDLNLDVISINDTSNNAVKTKRIGRLRLGGQ